MLRYSIQVPSADNNGRAFPKALLDTLLQEVVNRWGGCTVLPSRGFWVDGEGNLLQEEGLQVQVDTVGGQEAEVWAQGFRARWEGLLAQDWLYVTSQSISQVDVSQSDGADGHIQEEAFTMTRRQVNEYLSDAIQVAQEEARKAREAFGPPEYLQVGRSSIRVDVDGAQEAAAAAYWRSIEASLGYPDGSLCRGCAREAQEVFVDFALEGGIRYAQDKCSGSGLSSQMQVQKAS